MGTPLWRRLPAPLPQGGRGGRGELEASGLAAALPASSSHSRLHLLSCLAGHGEWLALCMRGSRRARPPLGLPSCCPRCFPGRCTLAASSQPCRFPVCFHVRAEPSLGLQVQSEVQQSSRRFESTASTGVCASRHFYTPWREVSPRGMRELAPQLAPALIHGPLLRACREGVPPQHPLAQGGVPTHAGLELLPAAGAPIARQRCAAALCAAARCRPPLQGWHCGTSSWADALRVQAPHTVGRRQLPPPRPQ